MENLTFCSVAELSKKLMSREISAVELAQHFLNRIEAHRGLNAFLDVRPEVTLEQAKVADARIAAGTATPLTGVPIGHKDIFVTRGRISSGKSGARIWPARPMETHSSPSTSKR